MYRGADPGPAQGPAGTRYGERVSRPAYHVDVATSAIPAWIAQPPGGIQTAGFPPHSKFAAAWANWLFNYLGGWVRELDQSCLRAIDYTSDLTPQLLKGSGGGFALPTGSGLIELAATAGGAYLIDGRRVDLSLAGLTEKYPTGWTLPNNSTVYAHAREEIDAGGSSTGEVLVSTNAVEAGYERIWTGTTDGTNLVSQTSTANDALQWTMPVDFFVPLTITDTADETAFTITASSTFAPAMIVTSTQGGAAIQAEIGNSSGTGFSASVNNATGTGYSATLNSSPAGAAGFRATVFGNAAACDGVAVVHPGTGHGMRIDHTGFGACVWATASGQGLAGRFSSTSTAASAVTITGGTGQALLATGSGSGAGVLARSGTTSGADALVATTQNADGIAVSAVTLAGASSTARAVKAIASGSAIAGEFIAPGNYALKLQGDTTSPQYGEIYFAGQNADPTQVFDGAMMWHSTQRQLKVSDASDMTFRGVHTSIGGYTHGHETQGIVVANSNPGWALAATAAATASNAPKMSGRKVLLRFTCDVRNLLGGSVNTLNVRLKDNGTVIVTRAGTGIANDAGYFLSNTTTNWQRSVVLVFEYTVTAGDHTFTAEVGTGTGDSMYVRDASLTVDGLY